MKEVKKGEQHASETSQAVVLRCAGCRLIARQYARLEGLNILQPPSRLMIVFVSSTYVLQVQWDQVILEGSTKVSLAIRTATLVSSRGSVVSRASRFFIPGTTNHLTYQIDEH